MGVVKCADCGSFVDADEIIWVEMDDTHDRPLCVSCCPDDNDESSDDYSDY